MVSVMSISLPRITLYLSSLLCLTATAVSPAQAQEFDLPSSGASGDYGHATNYTGESPAGTGGTFSFPTVSQSVVMNPTTLGRLTPRLGPVGFNGLPPTRLDSFVLNAGASADLIYGDEGTDGPPPYSEFTKMHRIESGIHGDTAAGLSTGHRANLPSAWGADEFLGAEWYYQPGASYNKSLGSDSAAAAIAGQSFPQPK